MKNLFLKAIKKTGNYLERKYRGLKVEKFELIPDGTSGIRVAKFLVKCSYKPESKEDFVDNAVEYEVGIYNDGSVCAFYERDYYANPKIGWDF